MSVRDYIYLKTLNFRSASHIFRYIIFKIVLAFQHLIKVRVLNILTQEILDNFLFCHFYFMFFFLSLHCEASKLCSEELKTH